MNMLPLYQLPELPSKSLDTNMGLWFERFFDDYDRQTVKIPDGKKFDWLQQFKKAGDEKALQTAACQQMDLVKQLQGKHKFFNTQWHFVTGTGYPHPVENGLSWHRTYGVPYLSGAAVKGLVRAWVEQWAEFTTEDERKECLLSWFGSESKQSKTNQAGDIIFFDALPVKEVKLTTDIMTPHCGKWYSEGGNIENVATEPERVPADWHDPVPIPFLVVDKATSYLFSIAPRNAQAAERVDINEVIDCLIQALEWLGAGAKTATGYGQMPFNQKIHDDLEKELQQIQIKKAEELGKAQEALAFGKILKNLSPLAQDYFTQIREQNWQGDRNAFWQSGRVEQWLKKLEDDPDPVIIQSIKALMNQHFAGLLANPDEVHGRMNKPVYKDRQQQIARIVNKL
jgi:CRISPR-associated protein Cmr6